MPRHEPSHPPVLADGLDRKANGVSIVIASYRTPDLTLRCLESLATQTLDPARYEVILVVNGPQARDVSAYEAFAMSHPNIHLKIIRSPLADASHAWNLGISAARMPWMTILDDDDTVTPRYLEGLLSVAGPGVVPITRIDDVLEDGTVNHSNRINDQLVPLSGKTVPPEDCMAGLTFNTAKLIPVDWARHIGYDLRLKSGQDIAFFGGLYATYDFRFAIVPEPFEAVYLRALTDDSMSRREADFEFSVVERLAVIKSLDSYSLSAPEPRRRVLGSLQRSQASFTRRYLDDHPAERRRVNETIRAQQVRTFPWEILTSDTATTLAVSVCFPPYSDPSAVTVAKRIEQAGQIVDVLSCNMSAVRQVDESLGILAAGWVDTVREVTENMAFSEWDGYRSFVDEGWKALRDLPAWPYDRIYSRAMWPASHVLAAYIKTRRPNTHWVAEFSDPLSRDVHGSKRPGTLPVDDLVHDLVDAASDASGAELSIPESVFALAELLPYALADEIVFTNDNQLRYMVSYAPAALSDLIRAKAVVNPHPIPAEDLYSVVDAPGPPHPHKANLAYFGTFYENRSLTDLIEALQSLPDSERRMLALDVFTSDQDTIGRTVERKGLGDIVSVRPAVSYLEFLNLTTKYDCLIVEDASTSETHELNPYLPSKWSDYRGSGTPVWAFVEEGSTLSTSGPEHITRLGHPEEATSVLSGLIDRAAARNTLDPPAAMEQTLRERNRSRQG